MGQRDRKLEPGNRANSADSGTNPGVPEKVEDLPPSELRAVEGNIERLTGLEREMANYAPQECEIIHHFAPGVYAREMRVPAGTFLTGKIHRFAHLNIMSAGKVTIVNESGRQTVEAPFSFTSEPGTKRAFYMHEFTVWTTIHPTDETDLEKLEQELTADSYEDLIK